MTNRIKQISHFPSKVYIILFVLLVLFMLVGGLGTYFFIYRDGSKFDNPVSKTSTPKVNNLEWNIESAEIIKNRDYVKLCKFPEGGNLVKVQLRAKNISDGDIEANTPLLYDKDKREFTLIESPVLCIYKPTKFTESIKPGFHKTYTLYYYIPSDAKDLKLKVFSGLESEYINLEI